MGILLRPLYAKVAFMRPDLEETAKIGFAVQEAMREVCRRTFLARTGMQQYVQAGRNNTSMPGDPTKAILMIHRADFKADGQELVTPMVPATLVFMQGRPSSPGVPRWYAQQGEMIHFWPSLAISSNLLLNVSYVPTAEVDEAPLPELAATAIEARAEAMILRVPGPYQNLQHAMDREQDFHRCIGNLKAISFYGEVGDLIAEPVPYPGVP